MLYFQMFLEMSIKHLKQIVSVLQQAFVEFLQSSGHRTRRTLLAVTENR